MIKSIKNRRIIKLFRRTNIGYLFDGWIGEFKGWEGKLEERLFTSEVLSDSNKLLIFRNENTYDPNHRTYDRVRKVDYFLDKQLVSEFDNNKYVIMEKDNSQNHIIISYDDEEYINLKMIMGNELKYSEKLNLPSLRHIWEKKYITKDFQYKCGQDHLYAYNKKPFDKLDYVFVTSIEETYPKKYNFIYSASKQEELANYIKQFMKDEKINTKLTLKQLYENFEDNKEIKWKCLQHLNEQDNQNLTQFLDQILGHIGSNKKGLNGEELNRIIKQFYQIDMY